MKPLPSQKIDNKIYALVPGEEESERLSRSGQSPIERYELPAHISGRVIYILLALLLTMIVWACWARIDVVVEAKGKFIPFGQEKIIQPNVDGTISSVHVKEGELVKTGQLLVSLDKEHYEAELRKVESELSIDQKLVQQEALAKAALEQALKVPSVQVFAPAEIGGVAAALSELYSSSKKLDEAKVDNNTSVVPMQGEFSSGDITILKERLSQLQAELNAKEVAAITKGKGYKIKVLEQQNQIQTLVRQRKDSNEETAKLDSIIAKTHEQAKSYEKAFRSGIVSNVDYLNVCKQVETEERNLLVHQSKLHDLDQHEQLGQLRLDELRSEETSQEALLKAEMKRLQADIQMVRMQLRDTARRFQTSKTEHEAAVQKAESCLRHLEGDIKNQQQKIKERESQITISQHALSQTELRAPATGIVTGINFRGPQQVVARGEELMRLVPEKDQLLLEVSVANPDIGFMKRGQPVKIKVDAFPFQNFGIMHGVVTEVESSPQDKDGESFYKVRIQRQGTSTTQATRQMEPICGMSASAEIVTRQETVAEVILEPLTKMKYLSIKE